MAKKWLLCVGIVAFLGGIASFIPNPLVGTNSFFQLTMLSAVISVLVGAYLIYASYGSQDKFNNIFRIWGVVFVALAIAGFLFGISLNAWDSWLSLLVGIIFITLSEKTKPVKQAVPAK